MLSGKKNVFQAAPLGKRSTYIAEYTPELLFSIPRQRKRDEINVPMALPFFGFDTWNAYEVSWLNNKGKPQVAILRFDISCFSRNIIESKSFKLYLNSFNNTRFASAAEVKKIIAADVSAAVDGEVQVSLYNLDQLSGIPLENYLGECIDDYEVTCDIYSITPSLLSSNSQHTISETLFSHLLKSNCLVTNQPDWGSLMISYTGAEIAKEGLLQYIVSFRNHNDFHEQCVERIFMDIMRHCQPSQLTVEARYTRRGGLDINPVRSTDKIGPAKNRRMVRQ